LTFPDYLSILETLTEKLIH